MEFLLTSPETSSGVRHQDNMDRTKRDGGLPVLSLPVELSEVLDLLYNSQEHGKSFGGCNNNTAKRQITGTVQGVGDSRRHATQTCIATNGKHFQ
jgi:hypothetical protein